MVQDRATGVPTVRTCLKTFASDPPGFYVTYTAHWGVRTGEPGRLITLLERNDEGRTFLACPAVIFAYHEQNDEALRETAIAGIYAVRADGTVGQQEGSIITVYRLFTLAHFRKYAAFPAGSPLCAPPEWNSLLAYAREAFDIALEMVEDPLQPCYRRRGGTAKAGFPLWATLLHQLLVTIKRGINETAWVAVDWQKIILALLPLVERLALHTDWPLALCEPGSGEGRR